MYKKTGLNIQNNQIKELAKNTSLQNKIIDLAHPLKYNESYKCLTNQDYPIRREMIL